MALLRRALSASPKSRYDHFLPTKHVMSGCVGSVRPSPQFGGQKGEKIGRSIKVGSVEHFAAIRSTSPLHKGAGVDRS